MTATVTIDYDEFRRIESMAEVMQMLQSDETTLVLRSSYALYAVKTNDEANALLVKDLAYAIKSRDDTIEKVREYEKQHKVKIFPY